MEGQRTQGDRLKLQVDSSDSVYLLHGGHAWIEQDPVANDGQKGVPNYSQESLYVARYQAGQWQEMGLANPYPSQNELRLWDAMGDTLPVSMLDGDLAVDTAGNVAVVWIDSHEAWQTENWDFRLRTAVIPAAGVRVTKHYYANGQRIATRVDDALYYVLGDHLGSTSVVVDESGAEQGYVIYDAYGQVVENTLSEGLTDRLFTSQVLDPTGLYYYNARYYDPLVGQFTQPDSLVADPMNPAAWNRFSYVYNSPSNYVDPSGHIVDTALDLGSFLLSLNEFDRNPTWGNLAWLGVDAFFLAVPVVANVTAARHLGKLDDAGKIDDIYKVLRSTEAGEQIYQTAGKHGLPTVIFDDAMEIGRWGYYDKELNLIGLNPVYRSAPSELGAATLGHELAHRTTRWFSGSQSNEFFAHMVEASVWGELRGRVNMPFRFSWRQVEAFRSVERIFALATGSVDGSSLMRYIRNHPRYGRYPISSKNLWKEPLWNFFTRPRGR